MTRIDIRLTSGDRLPNQCGEQRETGYSPDVGRKWLMHQVNCEKCFNNPGL